MSFEQDEQSLHTLLTESSYEQAQSLLERGANVRARNARGATPLITAAKQGDVDLVALLLTHGADLEATDLDGNTALHQASFQAHVQCVELLLKRGAQVDTRNKFGFTPLHLAVRRFWELSGETKQGRMTKQQHVVKSLLASGGDPTLLDYSSRTAPRLAIESTNAQLLPAFELPLSTAASKAQPETEPQSSSEPQPTIDSSAPDASAELSQSIDEKRPAPGRDVDQKPVSPQERAHEQADVGSSSAEEQETVLPSEVTAPSPPSSGEVTLLPKHESTQPAGTKSEVAAQSETVQTAPEVHELAPPAMEPQGPVQPPPVRSARKPEPHGGEPVSSEPSTAVRPPESVASIQTPKPKPAPSSAPISEPKPSKPDDASSQPKLPPSQETSKDVIDSAEPSTELMPSEAIRETPSHLKEKTDPSTPQPHAPIRSQKPRSAVEPAQPTPRPELAPLQQQKEEISQSDIPAKAPLSEKPSQAPTGSATSEAPQLPQKIPLPPHSERAELFQPHEEVEPLMEAPETPVASSITGLPPIEAEAKSPLSSSLGDPLEARSLPKIEKPGSETHPQGPTGALKPALPQPVKKPRQAVTEAEPSPPPTFPSPKIGPEPSRLQSGPVAPQPTAEAKAGGPNEPAGEGKTRLETTGGAPTEGHWIFRNIGFGVGVGWTHNLGERRIESATVVNRIVRIQDERNDLVRFMPEVHLWMDQWDEQRWSWGPFLAVAPGSNFVDAVGFGLLLGYRARSTDQYTFNLGIGGVLDLNAQVLGDGLTANEPLPHGERSVRTKETTVAGLLVLLSFGWDLYAPRVVPPSTQ